MNKLILFLQLVIIGILIYNMSRKGDEVASFSKEADLIVETIAQPFVLASSEKVSGFTVMRPMNDAPSGLIIRTENGVDTIKIATPSLVTCVMKMLEHPETRYDRVNQKMTLTNDSIIQQLPLAIH